MTLDNANDKINEIAQEFQFDTMSWGIRSGNSYIWRKLESETLTLHLYTNISQDLYQTVKEKIIHVLCDAHYVMDSTTTTDRLGIGEDIVFVTEKVARRKRLEVIIKALKNSSVLKWIFGIIAAIISAILIKWLA